MLKLVGFTVIANGSNFFHVCKKALLSLLSICNEFIWVC